MHLHDDPRALVERHAVARAGRPPRLPPGAQAPSHGASSTFAGSPPSPCRRSRSSPARASRRPSPRPRRPGRAATWNRITWCTTSGLPGRMLVPVRKASCVELRVEEEAAVVVGADAVGRRRACTPPASPASTRRSPARSGLGLAAAVGVAAWLVALVTGGRRRGLARRRRAPAAPGGSSLGRRRRCRRPRAGRERRGQRRRRRDAAGGSSRRPGHRRGRRARARGRGRRVWPAPGAGVEDQPVAVAEPSAVGDRGRRASTSSASGRRVARRPARRRSGVVARDDQHVGRRLRVDVAEGHRRARSRARRRPGCPRRRSCRTGSPAARAHVAHAGRACARKLATGV